MLSPRKKRKLVEEECLVCYKAIEGYTVPLYCEACTEERLVCEVCGKALSLGDFLYYKNKYYSLSSNRFPYKQDKTKDERYFILTLFAIARELESLSVNNDGEGDSIPVVLLGGLSPEHFGTLKNKFRNYFLRNAEIYSFVYKGKPYRISFQDVCFYPQGYAAAVTQMDKIKDFSRSIVIEIGGYTTEIIRLLDGRSDPFVIKSLEYGAIHLYNQLQETINREYDLNITESDMDAVLNGQPTVLSKVSCDHMTELARQFSKKLLSDIREKGIDLKTAKPIFGGGGYTLLGRFISENLSTEPIYSPPSALTQKGIECSI